MRNKSLFLSLVLVLAVLLSACGSAVMPGAAQNPRVISVSGTGQVLLEPDMAYIYIGVSTEAESAADAVARNNADTQRLIDTLKAAGIAEADIRTSNFSIWQNTPYGMDGQPGKPVYRVDNTVYVTVRDLSKLGSLLDSAVRAGANNINSIQFDVADKTQALSQARKAAVEAAKKQAEELAQAAGVNLGDIQNIQYYDATPIVYTEAKGMGGGGDAAALNVPINPGQMQITATVTISFEIK
ncbi:MAG: SIMPL domain-containing protein [Anaerolineae bacterium]|nr:MAG: SIMPL domain-containing protein [Anaerolineae bacterium]